MGVSIYKASTVEIVGEAKTALEIVAFPTWSFPSLVAERVTSK